MTDLIMAAGIAHLALAFGSLAIPKLLAWKQQLSPLQPLYRQQFWVYAGFTFGTNVFFGIISILTHDQLLDTSTLSAAITVFISIYWIARLFIQFFYFDRKSAPKGFVYAAGEIGLVTLFIYFSVIYGWAFFLNVR